MTREQELAILERATTPRFVARTYECRLCGVVTAERETQRRGDVHRPDCPLRDVLG
jgi:hypothetical protein